MKTEVRLKIAGLRILMRSNFGLYQFCEKDQTFAQRYNNFFYSGKAKPHIIINVNVVDKFPSLKKAKPVYITYHFQDGKENWRLLKDGNSFIYRTWVGQRKQHMQFNKEFNRIRASLLPNKDQGRVWGVLSIIYDFLQVIFISYLAQRKMGIITHAMAVKDLDGQGLLFAGKSGAGKTTMAKIWYRHSKAMILNDDRVILLKARNRFFIHGSPWHGDFSDYLTSHIDAAPLKRIFFIYHASQNKIQRIYAKEAFRLIYPALLPPFWDKAATEKILSFCQELLAKIPCYRLGFKKGKKIIDFVRGYE